MEKLNASPALETIVQALLFRLYSEDTDVETLLNSIDDDDDTWFAISEALGMVDDKTLLTYILETEADDVKTMDTQFKEKSEVEGEALKAWVVKRTVGTLLVILSMFSIAVIFYSPEELSPLIKSLLSIVGANADVG